MAVAKHGEVTRVEPLGSDALLLAVALPEPLGFIGGQYVIVDSGLRSPEGKAIKRAYSLLTRDSDQRGFELVVKRIPGGPGSAYVHALVPGSTLTFSGPWGKLHPAEGADGRTLVVATDTGITAALGLLHGARAERLLPQTTLIWLRESGDYFVPDSWVHARLPRACADVRFAGVPAVGHPERVAYVRRLLRDAFAEAPARYAFAAGDGAVNYAWLDDLIAAGLPATRDHVESFFNMPRKSA